MVNRNVGRPANMAVRIWYRRRVVRLHWPALVYLIMISIGFIVLRPSLVPPWVNIFQRSTSRKADTITEVETTGTFTKVSKENYRSRSTSTSEQPDFHPSSSSDCWGDRCYATDLKRDALESLITEIQKTVQTEREKILKLENQVRMLDLSERYLKERVEEMEGGIRREGNSEMIRMQLAKLMERMEMVEHRLSLFMASFMHHNI